MLRLAGFLLFDVYSRVLVSEVRSTTSIKHLKVYYKFYIDDFVIQIVAF